MSKSILDLIDVKFQDVTSHVSFTSDDIMGIVMPFYWGEADKVGVYDKTSFYEMFPESLPIGVSDLTNNDRDIYSGFAQVKSYFAHGGGQVEVVRPSAGFQYQRFSITPEGVVNATNDTMGLSNTQHDEESAVSVALKYAGFVPQSLAAGFDNISVKVEDTTITDYEGNDKCVKITVLGVKGTGNSISTTILESFEGSAKPNANINGESVFLEDVVKSDFIDVKVFAAIGGAVTETTVACVKYNNGSTNNNNVKLDGESDNLIAVGVKNSYKLLGDFEVSNATLIINPFVNSTIATYEDVNTEISNIAEERKNVLGVIGYPVQGATYDKTSIEGYFANSLANGNKFCIALQGREIISLFGYRYTLNCTGGYCGKMINVAKEAHLNQIASGYIYGLYGGSLKETLLSGEVIDLMEKGINSVYVSKRGNVIWGTRTMYSRQSSYFGKANVMRVCAAILKNIYPIAIETLHSDAASNPVTRASVGTMLNSIIDTFISNQDLLADSYADCGDALNTDYLTKGGTIFNIVLVLHFIELVEKISIKIIATDTSVTAEFV